MRSEILCQQVACSHPVLHIHMKEAFAELVLVIFSAPPLQDVMGGGGSQDLLLGNTKCRSSPSKVPVIHHRHLLISFSYAACSGGGGGGGWGVGWGGGGGGQREGLHCKRPRSKPLFCCVLNMDGACCRHSVAAASTAIKLNDGGEEVQREHAALCLCVCVFVLSSAARTLHTEP